MAEDDPKTKGKRGKARQPIAVALAYEPERATDAPRVTATGRGKLAERIVNLAFKSGVKVREDADLAQVLAAVEVDTMIPLEAFVAVAEILAYVYLANSVEPPVVPAS